MEIEVNRYYRLTNPKTEEVTIAYCYRNPDMNNEIGFGFNTADGGGFLPLSHLSEISGIEITEFNIITPISVARRSGRTTRQVDAAIQELFMKGEVTLQDHASAKGNRAQYCITVLFEDRLMREHRITKEDVIRKNNTTSCYYKLKK